MGFSKIGIRTTIKLLLFWLIGLVTLFVYYEVHIDIVEEVHSMKPYSFTSEDVNKSSSETTNYNILFVSLDTAGLVSNSRNASLSSWPTMSASLQYYYTSIHDGYHYLYYTLNKEYTPRHAIIECVNWRYKNGTYKFRLQANYCKILVLYDVLLTYWDEYDFIVYMDSDAYIRTMNRTFRQWISKHFETETHNKSINDYAMIFVSQKPYKAVCTCFIIMATSQFETAKEMLQYWYQRIGHEKKDYDDANHVNAPTDQAVFNNQVYIVQKYKDMIYEIDETQIYNCQKPEKFYDGNPYFIHFHAFLRRRSPAKKCGTYEIFYKAFRNVNIFNNITEHVDVIRNCCVQIPNFKDLQELIYL